MTKEELIKEADELKAELIDIIRTYYHKNETLDENLRKYNKFFAIPVSKEDVEYIINNKYIDKDEVKSMNEYISIRVGNRYGRHLTNVYKHKNTTKIPDRVRNYIRNTFDKRYNKITNYYNYIGDVNNYHVSIGTYFSILKQK